MSKLSKMLKARANAWAAARERESGTTDLHDDLLAREGVGMAGLDSGLASHPKSVRRVRFNDIEAPRVEMEPLLQQVTLVVYGWHNAQPGTLSWVFPSVRMAVNAAKAMRNAVRWAIVSGQGAVDSIDEARASGSVLIEHS